MNTTPDPALSWATLAPELLSTIFEHLGLFDCVRASTVCVFWRAAARSHSILWKHLDFSDYHDLDVDMLEALLPRSKDRPIDLHVHCPDEVLVPRFVFCLRSHLHHMRTLHIRLYLGCWELLNEAFTVPAPMLTSLTFSGVTDARIPEDLFAGVAPALTSLSLTGFELPPHCPALHSVQTFSAAVDNTNDAVASREIRNRYDVLPNMTSLALQGLSEGIVIPLQPPGRVLQHVEIRGAMSQSHALSRFRLTEIERLDIIWDL